MMTMMMMMMMVMLMGGTKGPSIDVDNKKCPCCEFFAFIVFLAPLPFTSMALVSEPSATQETSSETRTTPPS